MARMMRVAVGAAIFAVLSVLASANVCSDAVNSAKAEVEVKCFNIDTVNGDQIARGCLRTQKSTGDVKISFEGKNGFSLTRIEAKVGGTRWLLINHPLMTSKNAVDLGRQVLQSPTAVKFQLSKIPSDWDGCCNDNLFFDFNISGTDGVQAYQASKRVISKLTCSEQCSDPSGLLSIGKCLPNTRGVCKGCFPLNLDECFTPEGDVVNVLTDNKSCTLSVPNQRLGMYHWGSGGSLACDCVDLWPESCVDEPKENSLVDKCLLPNGKFGKVTGVTEVACEGCTNFLAPQCVCAPLDVDECLDMNDVPNQNQVTQANGGGCILNSSNGIYGITIGKLPNNSCLCTDMPENKCLDMKVSPYRITQASGKGCVLDDISGIYGITNGINLINGCSCTDMPDNKCFDRMVSSEQENIMEVGDLCADIWFQNSLNDPGSGVYSRDESRRTCECDSFY